MGFLSAPNLVPWLIWWLVTAGSHCTSTWQGGDERKRKWLEGRGGGDYSRKAINRGTAIIPRNTVHETSLSPAGQDTDSKIPANNFHQTNHSTNKLFIYPTALEQSSWTRLQQSHIAWIVMIMELKSLANISKRHDFGILLSYPRVGPVSRNVTAPTMFWNVAFQSEVFPFSTDPLIFCHGVQATKTLCCESRGIKIQTFSLQFHMEFIIVVFYSAWTELCWMELLTEHLKNKHLTSFNWFNKDARKFRF